MTFKNVRSAALCAATAAATVAVVVAVPVTAGAAEGAPSWCTTRGELRAENLPDRLPPHRGCDLTGRSIRSGAVVLEVQPAGFGVRLDGYGAKHGDFSLSTLPDGTVVVGREDEAGLPSGTNNPLNPDPCAAATSSAYSFLGHKAYVSVGWYYNGSGAPASVAGAAQSTISTAGWGMANGRDSCGISTIPRDSYHSYNGGTGTSSSPTASDCGAYDGVSVIGWGLLNKGTLAVACTWYYTDASPYRWASSDMEFNTGYSWTTDVLTCVGASTVGAYDLKSIATHEWGHVFGLGHVAESGASSSQTMSTSSDGTCQDNEASLGRGDLNGMVALYGAI